MSTSVTSFNLKEKLVVNDDQLVLLSLYNATIPHSFFNIRDGVNDKIPIKLSIKDNMGGNYAETFVIQLDDGNYDSDQLIRQIIYGNSEAGLPTGQKPFQSSKYKGYNSFVVGGGTGNAGGSADAGQNYSTTFGELSVFYNDVNNCFRFQLEYKGGAMSARTLTFEFVWASAATIGSATTNSTKELANAPYGFSGLEDFPTNADQVEPSTANLFFVDKTQTFCVLQSQQVIDLNDNIHGLMLRTNLVSKSTMSSTASVFSNILARIPINSIQSGMDANGKAGKAQQGGIIYFNPSEATHQCLVDLKAIDTMGVRLTDDNDTTIDLNGLNFQFALLIQYVEKVAMLGFAPSREVIDNAINQNKVLAQPQQSIKITNGKSKSKK